MDRGYKTTRKQPKRQPRRMACPRCGKKGLGLWRLVIVWNGFAREVRTCRYCQHTQTRDVA